MTKQIWKIVMALALIGMLIGSLISFYGISTQDERKVITGLSTVIIVCVSWWFWVMFIIRSIIKNTETTCSRISEIHTSIRDVKKIIASLRISDK